MNYRLAYAVGFHPWEDATDDPPFVERITELLAREEADRSPPYGPPLDLGAGSGIWGVELAQRGWDVTGVDIVEKALERARVRARDADVSMRLVVDSGTFHGLTDSERVAMGQEVDAVAAADATVLLLVWPRRRRPLIRGANRDEIEVAFPGWKITDVVPSFFRLPKPLEAVMKPDEHWYRLCRE